MAELWLIGEWREQMQLPEHAQKGSGVPSPGPFSPFPWTALWV